MQASGDTQDLEPGMQSDITYPGGHGISLPLQSFQDWNKENNPMYLKGVY